MGGGYGGMGVAGGVEGGWMKRWDVAGEGWEVAGEVMEVDGEG